MNYSNNKSA